MRKITFILLLFSFYTLSSQSNSVHQKKNPSTGSVEKKYNTAQTQALVNVLKHDTCLDKKFSVVFYLIQDSSYSLPTPSIIATYSLTQAINLLNTTFSRICVSFEHCKTVIIPNYPYNKWNAAINGTVIMQNWFTDNTLNIYIPETLQQPGPDSPEDSYASYLPQAGNTASLNAIVVQKNSMMNLNESLFSGHNLLHAVGHFFGLPHTSAEINPAGASTVIPAPPSNAGPPIVTLEYVNHVNIANCEEHGDGFCDTEADPYPSTATSPVYPSGASNCAYTNGLKDGHGDFYLPPCDNIMSSYGTTRCRFSQQQYNYMAYIILTRRLYLH